MNKVYELPPAFQKHSLTRNPSESNLRSSKRWPSPSRTRSALTSLDDKTCSNSPIEDKPPAFRKVPVRTKSESALKTKWQTTPSKDDDLKKNKAEPRKEKTEKRVGFLHESSKNDDNNVPSYSIVSNRHSSSRSAPAYSKSESSLKSTSRSPSKSDEKRERKVGFADEINKDSNSSSSTVGKKTNKSKEKEPKHKLLPSSTRKYTTWDFGKKHKNFTPPPNNKKTNAAATQIQRLARGGWQRIKYKIAVLEYKLANRDKLTQQALDKVRARTKQRKEQVKKTLVENSKKITKQEQIEQQAAADGHRIIDYLRRENKKIREKNKKIYAAICALKLNNERLESANNITGDSFSTLHAHAKEIEETHEKLKEVVPKYEESVKMMKDALDVRNQYYAAEHAIKVMYVKCVGEVVELMESQCKDQALVQEIVQCCLDVEGDDAVLDSPSSHEATRPSADLNEDDSDSDSDNYDDFTVATLED